MTVSVRTDGSFPALHILTDDEVCARPDFRDAALSVLRAGGERLALHLRMPHATGRRAYDLASWLREASRASGSWLVVNDRVDVALAVSAEGVQLGARSLLPADAAAISRGRLRIGVSVHAGEDAPANADWVIAGNVLATASHPGRPGTGLAPIRALSARGARPVAVGGITPEHLPALRAAGAAGVAVIRGVWNAPEAGAAVAGYLERWER